MPTSTEPVPGEPSPRRAVRQHDRNPRAAIICEALDARRVLSATLPAAAVPAVDSGYDAAAAYDVPSRYPDEVGWDEREIDWGNEYTPLDPGADPASATPRA